MKSALSKHRAAEILYVNVNYKALDNLTPEAGTNVFFGDYPHTFFGQFENNTNIYTAVG